MSNFVASIDEEHRHNNLSSAIRLFVLERFRQLSNVHNRSEAQSHAMEVAMHSQPN